MIWKGCWYLEGYGEHPGLVLLVIMILAGILSGLGKGWLTMLAGGAFMFAVWGPMFMYGAYSRTKEWQKSEYNRKKNEV